MTTSREIIELRHIADRLACTMAKQSRAEFYALDCDTAQRLLEAIDAVVRPAGNDTKNCQPVLMTMERAAEITAKCVESAVARCHGKDGDEYVPLPEGVSPEEMCIANRMVGEHPGEKTEGGRKMQMRVDPRGLALHYAFEHYGKDIQQLIEALGYELKNTDKYKSELEQELEFERNRYAIVQ